MNTGKNSTAGTRRRMAWAIAALLSLSACSSVPTAIVLEGLGAMKDKALESVGVKKADVPEAAKPERNIQWRLQASTSLNTDPQGQPLALLTRIYKAAQPQCHHAVALRRVRRPCA